VSTIKSALPSEKGISTFIRNRPIVAISFLCSLIPSIAEEPDWRGLALPHMQKRYGPDHGHTCSRPLHGIWHLLALFKPMLGPFTWNGFVMFVLTATAGTFIYTWVFNNTRDSVWIAMLLHSYSNVASKLASELVPKDIRLAGGVRVFESGWIRT
jgi:membrane protease YdiL (CAAX protease family)